MRSFLAKVVIATLTALIVLATQSITRADVVTLRDPAFDLPHVCADTDLEAGRQQGYEAARDRITQFLLVMTTARGTIHGAVGGLGIGSSGDIQARREGYSRAEYARMFNNMPADAQALWLAYVDGVNNAISDMIKGDIPSPVGLRVWRQSSVAGLSNLFGNAKILTQGEGGDPHYLSPGLGPYVNVGLPFTPEMALSFAVLQIRDFGFEAWDELGMAEDLEDLINQYGATTGAELWDDRHWKNDPLAPVSVPDPRAPGFGGPLSKVSTQDRVDIAKAVKDLQGRVRGRTRLPGYPMRDYTDVMEPVRLAREYREAVGRKWGAWPSLGSYAWTIASDRSATGNPWVGGFPQTGIQVPSIMHYTEIRGDTIKGNGMAFVGAPYVLIGHTDDVAYTTTTARLKVIDSYIEELVNGDFDDLMYDNHGSTVAMQKRVEQVWAPNILGGNAIIVPVFRTNQHCSSNGCDGGDRPVLAFAGDHAGSVDSAGASSMTDTSASFTAGALVGGHVAIVDGTGAGQMRAISANTTDTITVGSPFAVVPDASSEYVVAEPGSQLTAVSFETSVWMQEAQGAFGFSQYQKTGSVLDVREALRQIPSTHNFIAADNQPYNGVGIDNGNGNIYYGTSGHKRVRSTTDSRLPLDGSAPNEFVIVGGAVGSATPSSLTDTAAFTALTLTSAATNYTYDNPDDNGVEYIVRITAGDAYGQVRRISSNTADTLTLEHDWGLTPSAGDTYEVYKIWATPEAMNPAEGFTANWNNKQTVANDIMLSRNGRNHRVEHILEQLSTNVSVDRSDLRDLNKFVAGVEEPGTPGRYLLGRLAEAIAAEGDCGTIDDDLITHTALPERGRAFTNALIVPPPGTTVAASIESLAPEYIRDWATDLASDIYADEYGPAGVGNLTGSRAVGWVLHAIDGAAGDVTDAYTNVYTGDYFNGSDWKQVVRDSFCNYAAANPTIGSKDRDMRQYNHPLAALCSADCFTPIEFDPTPQGNRGTWEQIVEVGSSMQGEFIYPMGQSGHIDGFAADFSASNVKQVRHTHSLQPLWRDWRFAPMLRMCEHVTFGVDEDGDQDDDGVNDGFETYYYGDLSNDGSSDTDGDGATLATEWQELSDPTLADTDEDGLVDGVDVQPQDRLCVKGTLKKLSVKDSTKPGKDKVAAKWSVPLNVCIGSDYETPCATDADCGAAGVCRRINLNPTEDDIRVLIGDDTPIFDGSIPRLTSPVLYWKNKKFEKFSYKDKDGVNGQVAKVKVQLNEKKGELRLDWQAKKLDLAATPDVAQGAVGMRIGYRCFQETSSNCKQKTGKLSCKADL